MFRKNTMTFSEFLDFISSDNPSAANQLPFISTKAEGSNFGVISAHNNFHFCIGNILKSRNLKRMIEKSNYPYHQVRVRCFLAYGENRKFSPLSYENIFFIFNKDYEQLKNFLVQCAKKFNQSGFILKKCDSDEAEFVDVK